MGGGASTRSPSGVVEVVSAIEQCPGHPPVSIPFGQAELALVAEMINKRRSVRDNMARLRDSLQTVSRCNRVLFQARGEQDALQSICEILVEAAQVDLAWIGYCEDDPEKTVRPIASAGTDADYLQRVHHSWGPADSGQEPVGDAVRSGRCCWVKDIRTAPAFSKNRPEALAFGYQSCVALPLIAETPGGARLDLRGALTLYARKQDLFDASRIGLFAELASNLACTIGRLRSHMAGDPSHEVRTLQLRGERNRVEEALRSSETRLRLVIDTIPAVAWGALPDGTCAFVNQRWSEYTGMTAEDAAGWGWLAAFHHDDVGTHMEKWRASLASAQPFENEARLRRAADGDYGWFLIQGAPLRDERGKVVRWYGTATEIEHRKRVEQALRRSEAYLADAQRMSHTGSWALDVRSRRIVHSSEEHHRLFGFDPAAAMPLWDDWVGRIHPDDRKRTMETIEGKIRERSDFEVDCRTVHPDGTIKHIHAVGHPVLDPLGDLVEFAGTSIDMTERERAQEALRDSEERWRAVFENNPTMYFMVDSGGTVLSVNPLGAEQLGYTVDELTGDSVSKVLYEADRAAAQRNTTRCLEQLGRAMSWELRMVSKDGSMHWFRKTARAMLMKDRPVVLIACEDITDRKRAESLSSQVFESAPDGICIVGRDYRYRRSNPVYARRWGMSVEQIVGTHVSELLGLDAFDRTIKPNLDRCFAGEEVAFEWFSEFRGRLHLAVSYSPLRSGSEEVEAALVIQRDLTEYMRAFEALREAQMELAHVNRVTTMGQLAASIAHEIKQPLTGVVANADAGLRWLARQPPDVKEVRDALDCIVKDGHRAGDVINRIGALVKKAPPRKEGLEINEAILEVIALARGEMVKNGVCVQTRLAEALPLIQGDRVQLQQVILNLILNAVDAMSGVSERARELLIGTADDGSNGVLVEVRDSGPGLPPESLDRVFEAFYTTKAAGMGMGLSICRSIIEAHGGRIWASRTAGSGATVQFTLPVG